METALDTRCKHYLGPSVLQMTLLGQTGFKPAQARANNSQGKLAGPAQMVATDDVATMVVASYYY